MGKSDGESNETPCPKKPTRRVRIKARAHAPAPQKSLLSLFASRADVSKKYRLREKLEAAPRAVMRFFWSLRMDASDKGRANFSVQTLKSPSSIVHPAVKKMQVSETVKRARRGGSQNLHILTTSSRRTLPSIVSTCFPRAATPLPRTALLSLF